MTGAALVLLAAGRGQRAGGPTAKQFAVDGRGRSILARAAAAAAAAVEWSQIIIVAPPDELGPAATTLAAAALPRAQVVPGGDGRMDSLKRGVAAIDASTSIAVVHDGTRPFTPPALVRSVVEIVSAGGSDAAWPAARPANTVLTLAGATPRALPPADLLAVATPIAVRVPLLLEVLAAQGGPDGAVVPLLVSSGASWATVPDSPLNFKVTTTQDLRDALDMMESLHWPERQIP